MKIAIAILAILHGLIHLLGFVKAFNLATVSQLSVPVSKAAGIGWLLASLLFILTGGLFLTNHANSWIAGLSAIVFSQLLIALTWRDAKYGTIANLLILILLIVQYLRSSG